jgi:LuxR family maltose regulon positive regulatory protein
VARDSLMAGLHIARRQRCVVILGPAGSGKTHALLAWRRELLALNFDVAWLSLGVDDDPLESFLKGLQASVAVVEPGLGGDAGLLLDRDSSDSAVEHWMITLVHSIAQHTRELVLMLDDLHHLRNQRIFLALQWLLDNAPVNLHLVFSSRAAVPMPLARMRAHSQLSEFDLRDLRFSASETARFLQLHLEGIDEYSASVMHELTDGWVTGLQQLAVDFKSRQRTTFERGQITDVVGLVRYFEREVLVYLDPQDIQLLTCVSLCERFCASLGAVLLDQPSPIPDIKTRLDRLERTHFFVTRVKRHDRETWYRLHPLLRSVLQIRLKHQPQVVLQKLHADARGWLMSHGYLDEAMRHAVQAGDTEAAVDIVEACANDLLAQGNLSQLSGLLRSLTAEQVAERFGLHIVMAHLHLYARNFEAFGQCLQHLKVNSTKLANHQRHELTVLQGSLALHRDDTDAMLAILPELLAIPADADDFAYSGRSNMLAWLYMRQGDVELARDVLETGGRPLGSPRRSLLGCCMNGMCLALEGHISQAENLFREVLAQAEGHGASYLIVSSLAAVQLSSVLYEQGDHEAACQLLERRMRLLERVAIPSTVQQAMQTIAMAHWLVGRRAEAWYWLARLEDYAKRHELPRLSLCTLSLRLRWLQQIDDEPGAEAVVQGIEQIAQRFPARGSDTLMEIQTIARHSAAVRRLHKNDFVGANADLQALIEVAQNNQNWRYRVVLHLQMAVAERGLDHLDESRRNLIEALRLGHRYGLVRGVLDAWTDVPAMIEALLACNTLDAVLSFYARRLMMVACNPSASAGQEAGQVGAHVLSIRELEVLGQVAQALPNKKIARVLNLSPETVKWHMKNIFYKLGVTGRDEAIAKTRDLGLKLPGDKTI